MNEWIGVCFHGKKRESWFCFQHPDGCSPDWDLEVVLVIWTRFKTSHWYINLFNVGLPGSSFWLNVMGSNCNSSSNLVVLLWNPRNSCNWITIAARWANFMVPHRKWASWSPRHSILVQSCWGCYCKNHPWREL